MAGRNFRVIGQESSSYEPQVGGAYLHERTARADAVAWLECHPEAIGSKVISVASMWGPQVVARWERRDGGHIIEIAMDNAERQREQLVRVAKAKDRLDRSQRAYDASVAAALDLGCTITQIAATHKEPT